MAYDAALARRALVLGALAALLVVIVQVTTDGGLPWGWRLAMCAALAPAAGAVGTLVTVRVAELRGEARALGALGVRPLRAVRGAILGGAAVGLLGVALLACPAADLGALFPRPAEARAWSFDADGGMSEPSLGVRLDPSGSVRLARSAPAEPPRPPAPPRAIVASAFLLLALILPAWIALPSSAARRLGVAVLGLGATIVSFQLVAAGRASSLGLLLAPLLLALDLAARAWRAVGLPPRGLV